MVGLKYNIGDLVTYCPLHGPWENGIVKSNRNDSVVAVVYRCDGNWEQYDNYTGEWTYIKDLRKGWIVQEIE